MATASPIAALLALYDTLPAAGFPSSSRPNVYFDEAPAVQSGSQLRVPYVVISDSGLTSDLQSNYGGTEAGEITVDVFALTLADVDQIVLGIRFGNQVPANRAGFDFGTLLVSSPFYHVSLAHVSEQRSLAGYDLNGSRLHTCRIVYHVVRGLTPT